MSAAPVVVVLLVAGTLSGSGGARGLTNDSSCEDWSAATSEQQSQYAADHLGELMSDTQGGGFQRYIDFTCTAARITGQDVPSGLGEIR